MMSVKDSACSQVALRVRGDTGQSKGGAQKSVDAVHSTCDGICLGKEMVRPPGIEPGSKAWKAFIITPRQRSLESVFNWSVEGSNHGKSTKRNMDSTPFHDDPHTTSSPENRLDLRLLLNQVHWSVSGRLESY